MSLPHHAAGLIALFKSREFVVEELNRFFAKSHPALSAWNPGPYGGFAYRHFDDHTASCSGLIDTDATASLITRRHRPHPSWVVQRSGADRLLKLEGLNMIVVKEVVEPPAVNAVLVVPKILRAR